LRSIAATHGTQVVSRNRKNSDFPIQNLPFGVFQPKQDTPRVGVAIGDLVFDLSALENSVIFSRQNFKAGKCFGRVAEFISRAGPTRMA